MINKSGTAIRFLVFDPQARGHALSCLLARSNDVDCVFLSRSSPLPDVGYKNIYPIYWMDILSPDDYCQIVSFCHDQFVDCVVVGTAHAMARGLVDELMLANINVIGADKNSSVLESSKCFSKALFVRHNINTPTYYTCLTIDDVIAVNSDIYPCFIKSEKMIKSHYSAVKVNSREEAVSVGLMIFSLQKKRYGASAAIILEKLCEGRELSLTILMSGSNWVALPICRDYKKLSDSDSVNTGGMGAITPVHDVSSGLYDSIIQLLVQPVVTGIVKESLNYNGFLYFGIIIDENDMPVLLELNCRLGDPEGQAMCSLLLPEFATILFAAAKSRLQKKSILLTKPGYICCVYSVPKSYPEQSSASFLVDFSETFLSTDTYDFYFGDLLNSDIPNTIMTYNNRTFCVSAWGETLFLARRLAYQKLRTVLSDGLYYRNDIGVLITK